MAIRINICIDEAFELQMMSDTFLLLIIVVIVNIVKGTENPKLYTNYGKLTLFQSIIICDFIWLSNHNFK